MDRNVGSSFTLSVLIVCVFAVILYQPETRRAAPAGRGLARPEKPEAAGPAEASPPKLEAAPRGVAGKPSVRPAEPVRPAGTDPGSSRPRPPGRPAASKPARAARDVVAQTDPRASNPDETGRRRGAFTTVRDGEGLADVARRVYGEETDPTSLWMANRDLIARETSPLHAGMVLRTP